MQRVLFVICCFVCLSSAFRNESESLWCGQNQVPACVPKCPPERTCRNRNIAFRCAEDPDPCTKKCVCADGYYKNAIGECITLAQCEQCDAPHTFYSCNSACDNECDMIETQNRTNCPIQNIMCNKWCYCDDGYARDAKGNCVPVEECPKTSSESSRKRRSAVPGCKGPNEIRACAKTCPPETCFSTIAYFNCDQKEVCQSRCICKPGYLRRKPGTPCIPQCECSEIANTDLCRKP